MLEWFFILSLGGHSVEGNPKIGVIVVDSVLSLNSNVYPQSNTIDIISSNYYNTGYTNFSFNISSTEI
jgi:hypothetical protein